MERRLTAILAADVVGYSRLMGANEVGTLQSLQQHQAELIEPEVAARQGRIVKLTGDGILAEFPSVVSAVECACTLQRGMRTRNAEVPEDRRIEFRVGINLGDVIVQGDDLFGDGVNVAARLESVALPGGIAVSQSVRDHVGNKLDLVFRDKGEQQLKNISQPVRVYDVVLEPAAAKESGASGPGSGVDKPSVAVLPFTNMSGDPEQEYFSDGITEDIITDLSKISGLFVVGRNTSFTYKGRSVQLQRVASELGVRFLIEGSVRKAGQRVRVTGQLIDGSTGGHLWAERYDRDLTDIFAVQDEIAKAIVDQLKVRLLPDETVGIGQAPTSDVEAYTHFLKGRELFHDGTKYSLTIARRMYARAIELDPQYARAYAGIATCDARLNEWYGVGIVADEILATAERAIELEPDLAEAHAARGAALAYAGRHAEATAAFERALTLNPNSFEANSLCARHCWAEGKMERAVELFIRALEIRPDDSQSPLLAESALRRLGRKEESEKYARLGLKRAEEALRLHPESSRPAQLGATALAGLGEKKLAKEWLERALAIDPDDNGTRYNAACTLSLIGETEQALDLLEICVEKMGPDSRRWMLYDADLDPLHDQPRYKRLIERLKSDEPGAVTA